jgi:mannose-1-phosphate guanylyltransferase
MKALFLVGGIGSRLKAMTKRLPKPMIPIFGKPLLARNIDRLKAYGVDEIVLSTCYLPNKIEEYFGDGQAFGMKISYVHEQSPLGTGGAIRNAAHLFDSTFLMFNGDIVSDIDFTKMLAFHKKKNAAVTIAATEVEDPSAYGVLEYDADSCITAFREKPRLGETDSHRINAGIYLFEPQILQEIPAEKCISIEKQVYPYLLQKNIRMVLYYEKAYWRDLGTPEDYLKFQEDVLSGKSSLVSQEQFSKNVYGICRGATIASNASIIEPVYIAGGTCIEDYSVIGPYAVLEGGTIVHKAAELDHCVIWPKAEIGSGTRIHDAVVLADSVIQAGNYEHAILTGNVTCSRAG